MKILHRSVMRSVVVASLLMVALAPSPASASGCYCAKPPKPSASGRARLDSTTYDLGKRIFTGKAALGAAEGSRAESQRATLAELEQRLPSSARRKAKLADLAGRLSDAELKALEYYVDSRFKTQP